MVSQFCLLLSYWFFLHEVMSFKFLKTEFSYWFCPKMVKTVFFLVFIQISLSLFFLIWVVLSYVWKNDKCMTFLCDYVFLGYKKWLRASLTRGWTFFNLGIFKSVCHFSSEAVKWIPSWKLKVESLTVLETFAENLNNLILQQNVFHKIAKISSHSV